jgi:hypothetical protein
VRNSSYELRLFPLLYTSPISTYINVTNNFISQRFEDLILSGWEFLCLDDENQVDLLTAINILTRTLQNLSTTSTFNVHILTKRLPILTVEYLLHNPPPPHNSYVIIIPLVLVYYEWEINLNCRAALNQKIYTSRVLYVRLEFQYIHVGKPLLHFY